MQKDENWIPGPQVDQRYNISSRTRARWQASTTLGFPKPLKINGRDFFRLAELEAWERARAAARLVA